MWCIHPSFSLSVILITILMLYSSIFLSICSTLKRRMRAFWWWFLRRCVTRDITNVAPKITRAFIRWSRVWRSGYPNTRPIRPLTSVPSPTAARESCLSGAPCQKKTASKSSATPYTTGQPTPTTRSVSQPSHGLSLIIEWIYMYTL